MVIKPLHVSALTLLCILAIMNCGKQNQSSSERGRPSHHGPKGFGNTYDHPEHGFRDFLRWRFGLGPVETPPIPPENVPPYVPNTVPPDLARIQNPPPQQIQVTWIGHATFLIQVDGINILTDPMFSERASPVSFAGPKRYVPPGVPFDSLPPIDAVIISHNHYDHLDAPTVRRLQKGTTFFIPLGLADWFEKRGMTHLVELDWWEASLLGSIRFNSVPAQHFSSRAPFDFDRTLWTGWAIETKRGTIFFAGDTGYAPHFKRIGETFGPIRVSLIPIGAYRPHWFMGPMHLDPAEAVMAHKDLRSAQSIAMHWGTFRQTDEPLGEPALYLKKALEEAGLSEEEFILMKFGETRTFP